VSARSQLIKTLADALGRDWYVPQAAIVPANLERKRAGLIVQRTNVAPAPQMGPGCLLHSFDLHVIVPGKTAAAEPELEVRTDEALDVFSHIDTLSWESAERAVIGADAEANVGGYHGYTIKISTITTTN